MRGLLLPLALLTVSAIGGCSTTTESDIDLRLSLERARVAWTSQGIDTYAFDMTRTCFCTGTHRAHVVVTNGAVTTLTDPDTGAPFAGPDSLFRTFDGLYDYVQDALNQDPDALVLSFDGTTGVPIRVMVDFVRSELGDDVRIAVENFVPAP